MHSVTVGMSTTSATSTIECVLPMDMLILLHEQIVSLWCCAGNAVQGDGVRLRLGPRLASAHRVAAP